MLNIIMDHEMPLSYDVRLELGETFARYERCTKVHRSVMLFATL